MSAALPSAASRRASSPCLSYCPGACRGAFTLLLASALAPLAAAPAGGSSHAATLALRSTGKVPRLSEPSTLLDADDENEEEEEEHDDVALMGAPSVSVTKKQRSVGTAGTTRTAAGSSAAGIEALRPAAPEDSNEWETQFAWAMYYSNLAVEGQESDQPSGGWVLDTKGSSGVPRHMLHAEQLFAAAVGKVPSAKLMRAKGAERALRLYEHAKWMAERGFAAAAEFRYREAATVAKDAKRNVLAAHALSRLGYYLVYWNRRDEAREVLAESEGLSSKSNPLAPYLHGVLEREAAGPDMERLKAAEQRILDAGDQPSEELQAERHELVKEIEFWRGAQESANDCIAGSNVAHVLICFLGHAAFSGGSLSKLMPRFGGFF